MSTYQAIARGLTARSAAATTPGAISWSAGAPTNSQGVSYAGWTTGQPNLIQAAATMPRPLSEFLEGLMGPLTPMQPFPLDTPQPGTDQPAPRQFEYPVGWNVPIGVPGAEGLKLAPFAQLRYLAESFSIIRTAIRVRKQEMLGLEWDIVPTAEAEKAMRNDPAAHHDWSQRRTQAVRWFERPDGDHGYHSWWNALLEDYFAVDATCLYLWPPRKQGRGILGSDVARLTFVDGTTVRPLFNLQGQRPRRGAPAYQQYMYGVPRVDLVDVILESDLEDMDPPEKEYRASQLLYLPYETRSWTPYGFPGIEQALIPSTTGLRKQMYALQYFVEGSIPGLFVIPGGQSGIDNPNKALALQNTLNALAGDSAWKHRIIVLPPDSKTEPQKPVALADQFDEVNIVQCLMSYDVMPMEVGVSPKVSTTQCYTEGTEVLTRDGWKRFEDVTVGLEGDEFATRNPKTKALEWQHATEYHEGVWNGEVVTFSARGFDLTVTPNHRMVTHWQESKARRGGRYGERFIEAEKIGARRVSLPATSVWEGSSPDTVRFGRYEWSAHDFAAFLGAWLAEGSLGRQYNKARRCWTKEIVLTQLPGTKGFGPYKTLLTRMLGRVPGYRPSSRSFFFSCSELWDYLDRLGKAADKHVPAEVKDWGSDELDTLLYYYLLGDGWFEPASGDTRGAEIGRWRARTVSRRLADDLQEVAQKLGGYATITAQEPKDSRIAGRLIPAANCQTNYVLGFNTSQYRNVGVGRSTYNGPVRCVSVPNMTLYVRRAGSAPVWCGNSPGAANQMAKASQAINERKALKPALMWWKREVFDFILQRVLHQFDMQWSWIGMEQGEDETEKVNRQILQVGHALRSVDELRVEDGRTPWGLPETSDPLWATQQGVVPLGQLQPNQEDLASGASGEAGVSEGDEPVSADGPSLSDTEGQPTGPLSTQPAPAAPAASGASTPSHAGAEAEVDADPAKSNSKPVDDAQMKAAFDEINRLRRLLAKGRPLAKWQPLAIPFPIWKRMLAADDPIGEGRMMLRAEKAAATRQRNTAAAAGALTDSLHRLVGQLRSGEVAKPTFVTRARDALHAGYVAVLAAAGAQAASDHNLDPSAAPAVAAVAASRADNQIPYLDGLADAVSGADPAASFEGRLQLYVNSLQPAYEQGYASAVTASYPDAEIVWHTTSAKPCAMCAPRDGMRYPATGDGMPGWPGDGGFGGEDPSAICEGGPNCKCWLEYVLSGASMAQTAPGGGPGADGEALTAAARPALVKDAPHPPTLIAAGLCVKADDSGRVLLIQRSIADETDPARGMWEFPGGHIEEGELPWDAARREWQEETGCVLPHGRVSGTWVSENGVYQCFVYVVDHESDVAINVDPTDRRVLNPDDPDQDDVETAAWWNPAHLPDMPALRQECQTSDWDAINRA